MERFVERLVIPGHGGLLTPEDTGTLELKVL